MSLAGCAKCVKGHHETVHHSGWTQFIYTGKTAIPIWHAAYDAEEFICDEYDTTSSKTSN